MHSYIPKQDGVKCDLSLGHENVTEMFLKPQQQIDTNLQMNLASSSDWIVSLQALKFYPMVES